MRNPTDETIEITCDECKEVVIGKAEIITHIWANHPSYVKALEVNKYAQLWLEAAYEKNEEAEASYWKSKAIDDAIDRDIEAAKERRS